MATFVRIISLLKRHLEISITLAYLSAGLLWILLSDTLLAAIPGEGSTLFTELQMLKGFIFVLTTAALLYVLLKLAFGALRAREDAIRRSAADFHYLFARNPQPMWIFDLDTLAFLDVNEAAILQYGYTRDEFLTMTIADIRPEEERARLMERIRSVRYQPDQIRAAGIWKHRRKDGQLIDMDVVSYPVLFQSRQAELVAARDVTLQVQTQTALQTSEERLSGILTSIRDAVWSVEIPGYKVLFANPAVSDIFGLPLNIVYTDFARWLNALHPDDRWRVSTALENIVTKGAAGSLIFRVVHPDQAVRWVNNRLWTVSDAQGQVTRVDGVSTDITEQMQIDELIRSAYETLQGLVDAAPLPIYVLDTDLNIKLWSRAAEELFGWTADDVIGKPLPILPSGREDELADIKRRVLQGEVFTNLETQRQHKDGTLLDVSISAAPLRNAHGALQNVMVIAQNITATKFNEAERLENERLRAALDKEIEMRAVRSRVISMISHDIRTPLTSILGSAELLQMYGDKITPENREKHLSRIRQDVRYTVEMLNELLEEMQSDVLAAQFNPGPIDIDALCAELVESIRATARRTHNIHYESEGQDLTIQGDARLLRRAVSNLLTNAVKYSPEGGSVWLQVHRNGSVVNLSVKDEGIGIPSEDRSRLFETFYRASNVGTIKGTGLGLAITRRAVDLHSGSITVESAPGHGSTFTITLPASTHTASQS